MNLEDAEELVIGTALERTRRNKIRAVDLRGINPATLATKLQNDGMKEPDEAP
jgi:DNA-binding protein Fis